MGFLMIFFGKDSFEVKGAKSFLTQKKYTLSLDCGSQ
jgi:hypothetical protein